MAVLMSHKRKEILVFERTNDIVVSTVDAKLNEFKASLEEHDPF